MFLPWSWQREGFSSPYSFPSLLEAKLQTRGVTREWNQLPARISDPSGFPDKLTAISISEAKCRGNPTLQRWRLKNLKSATGRLSQNINLWWADRVEKQPAWIHQDSREYYSASWKHMHHTPTLHTQAHSRRSTLQPTRDIPRNTTGFLRHASLWTRCTHACASLHCCWFSIMLTQSETRIKSEAPIHGCVHRGGPMIFRASSGL